MKVPPGTQIFAEDQETLLADLVNVGDRALLAKGGNGGFGNAHFKSSTNQAPRHANPGLPGRRADDLAAPEADRRRRAYRFAQCRQVDVPGSGVRGEAEDRRLPVHDAASQSRRRAKRASSDFVLADIPGLIEGAHEGAGLGDRFLGHVERCRVLLHLVDATQDDVAEAYRTVRRELKAYGDELDKKKEIVALSKCDAIDPSALDEKLEALKKAARKTPMVLSGVTGTGVKEALYAISREVTRAEKREDADHPSVKGPWEP